MVWDNSHIAFFYSLAFLNSNNLFTLCRSALDLPVIILSFDGTPSFFSGYESSSDVIHWSQITSDWCNKILFNFVRSWCSKFILSCLLSSGYLILLLLLTFFFLYDNYIFGCHDLSWRCGFFSQTYSLFNEYILSRFGGMPNDIMACCISYLLIKNISWLQIQIRFNFWYLSSSDFWQMIFKITFYHIWKRLISFIFFSYIFLYLQFKIE